ncbi:MAG TPA: helix-turn-helix domain-containing protein, partial [Candidatus Limnocylindrales bacterium]|nr:helix-turn-helix domain-containing protein [Candidatus Limnocylindrales bacterium]
LLRRRHRERLRPIGAEIRQMREDAGRSQRSVASVAGIARSHLTEVEDGDAEPSLLVLERIGMALGADLGVRYFGNTGPRIRDHLQVAMSETLLRELHARWRATPEVPVYRPVHGVIDLVLEDRAAGATVATELHSQVRRVEQQIRWQTQKADALASQPDQAGRTMSRLLILRNTQANRDTARAAAETFGAAYPARTRDAVASLREGSAWPGPAIAWVRVEGEGGRLLDAPPRGIAVGR